MNGKQFLGKCVSSFQEYDALGPITGVSVAVDDNQEYRAGDDSGYVLDVDCSWGSQGMADDLLAKLKGKTYQGFRAENGALPIDSELGDGITVGGIYSMLAYQKLTFGAGHMSEVAAPGESTLDHEYPYTSSTQRAFTREIASVRSSITKTSEEIRLQIQGVDDAVSSIDQKVDSITLSVSNSEKSSTITLSVDGVDVASETISMSGMVTFSGLSSGTTTIDGACIKTGTVSADRLNLTGAITWGDLADDTQDAINTASSTASTALSNASDAQDDADAALKKVNGWSYGSTTYIDGSKLYTGTVKASSLQGGSISLLNAAGNSAGSITLSSAVTADYAVDIASGSGGLRIQSGGTGAVYIKAGGGGQIMVYNGNTTFSGSIKPNDDGSTYCGVSGQKWAAVYAATGTIQTSDRNQKHDIEVLPENYLGFLKDLPAYRFKMNENTSDRYHVGYIAQDVEEIMERHGITSQEFGGFVKDKDADGNDIYMLRYEEFIAIHTAAIQDIYKKLGALQ